jgi:hypothetical protein
MKIVAWNIGHQAVKKAIRVEMIPALVECFNPQIIVLTEYVEGDDANRRDIIRNALIAQKFDIRNIHTTPYVSGNNSVLVATRMPSTKVGAPAAPLTTHAASNYLHVSIPDLQIELVGSRAATNLRSSTDLKCKYWKWLADNFNAIKSPRVIAIGDFNLDPDDCQEPRKRPDKRIIVDYFHECFPDGEWYVPNPGGDPYSYWGWHDEPNPLKPLKKQKPPSRLDHALLSRGEAFANATARYVTKDDVTQGGPYVFCGGPGNEKPMSNHAVLVLDVDVAPESSA